MPPAEHPGQRCRDPFQANFRSGSSGSAVVAATAAADDVAAGQPLAKSTACSVIAHDCSSPGCRQAGAADVSAAWLPLGDFCEATTADVTACCKPAFGNRAGQAQHDRPGSLEQERHCSKQVHQAASGTSARSTAEAWLSPLKAIIQQAGLHQTAEIKVRPTGALRLSHALVTTCLEA